MRRRPLSTTLAVIAVIAAACTSTGPPAPKAHSPRPTKVVTTIRPAGFALAAPIQREVAVPVGSKIYLAGGLGGSGSTASGVFALDMASGKLTAVGSLPTAVHDAAGALLNGQITIFGGGSTTGTNLVQAFDPATGHASIIGHLPRALSDLSSATVDGTPYLIGGYDNHVPRKEIYSTTDGKTFTHVADLPVGLRYPAVTVVGSTIVIAGGVSPAGPTDTVYAFDPPSGKVTTIGKLPQPVGDATAFTLGPTAYVVGGLSASNAATATVSAIDLSAKTVTAFSPLKQPLADAAVAASGSRAWIIGGAHGPNASDSVASVLLAQSRVVHIGPKPTPAASTSAASAAGPASASTSPNPADALVRPFAGLLLVADRGNNRLLVMNADKKIVWKYPSPQAASHVQLYFPDDAFWVHDGQAILVNEEENNTLIEIAYPSGRVIWQYGHPKVPGSSPGYLHQPDDLYPYPGGPGVPAGAIVADAMNCRILFFNSAGHPVHQIGTNGVCVHGLPKTVGYPNGDTPLPNGNILITELHGGYIDEVKPDGTPVWSRQVPGVPVPSDPQRLADGTFMSANYQHPGGVVQWDQKTGKVLWHYHPTSGPGELDHPSLAVPLPNGLVMINDDYRHRVVFVDPKTDKIVWQYGVNDQPGRQAGSLKFPDGMDLLLPGNVIPLHIDFTTPLTPGRP
jgi:PQQ-like domain/Kelch motif